MEESNFWIKTRYLIIVIMVIAIFVTIIIPFCLIFPSNIAHSSSFSFFKENSRLILPKGERLKNIHYNQNQLFCLTELRPNDSHPKCYKFRNYTSLINIKETITICEQ